MNSGQGMARLNMWSYLSVGGRLGSTLQRRSCGGTRPTLPYDRDDGGQVAEKAFPFSLSQGPDDPGLSLPPERKSDGQALPSAPRQADDPPPAISPHLDAQEARLLQRREVA